ncbi:MAG: Fe2+-dependent dioxygenase [Henriciella sp.]|nr:Fe2+-dependent dioxygenase [Henriciella sp.]
MLITIAGVLDKDALEQARGLTKLLRWADGAETAGPTAREVKQNLQADLSSRSGVQLRDLLTAAIQDHPVVQAAAQPLRYSKLIVSKTEPGGGYGLHIDNALMPHGADKMRTDLSFTLFLTDRDEYEGGELRIEHAGQSIEMKPQAGDLVLYPSTSLHQVIPVTSGIRLACVGWIESRIKRSEDRELLFDMTNLKSELSKQYSAQSAEMLISAKILSNMIRRFS